MSAQTPGSRFPDYSRKHSWAFMYERGFDYLTQLPRQVLGDGGDSNNEHHKIVSDNEMMFGGGFAQGKESGIADLGIASDAELSLYCDIHLSGALSAVFSRENWGPAPPSPHPAVKMMWTGNMGFSADGLPWVGRVGSSVTGRPDSEGAGAEWISAAFSGEGMVHAWLCGKELGRMILADDGVISASELDSDREWFPEQMLITEERLQRAVLPNVDDIKGKQASARI